MRCDDLVNEFVLPQQDKEARVLVDGKYFNFKVNTTNHPSNYALIELVGEGENANTESK